MSYQDHTRSISESFTRLTHRIIAPLTRGTEHRRRLEEIDVRIVVSGTRGKSGMTERLYDVLCSRGYDAYAKVTGNHPLSLYGGEEYAVARGERVTLYENVQELRNFAPVDALILENQGITDYTTRMMNEVFGKPDVLVVTNVRQDHRDTLGPNRAAIARSFARAVPEDTHVVNGERDPALRACLERELECVGATVSHVDIPDEHAHVPGAEIVYGVNCVLEAIDEPPLSAQLVESAIDDYRVEWKRVHGGRIYNAADVNDVESTELVRRALVETNEGNYGNGDGDEDGDNDGNEIVQPLLYLRRDRRARTASFYEYLEELADAGAIEQVRVAGDDARLFAEKASFPVVCHDETIANAGDVLDSALADGHPVLVMGNTVAAFMRDLDTEIEQRHAEFTAELERRERQEREREWEREHELEHERERANDHEHEHGDLEDEGEHERERVAEETPEVATP